MAIDVSTSGFGLDVTSAEFLFDGEALSAAISSMEWSSKTEDEVIHFQGLQNPQERTAGQRSFEATLTWGTRQYLLFCDRMGGWDEVQNKEFTLVINCEPRNDGKLYSLTFYKFRMHSDSISLDKSAAMVKVSASFLSFESEVVQN